MAVAVYPRLGQLLRERNLTVAELERQIEARFGLAVDRKTLYRLASSEAVQRADLEIAGAAAAILGVDLGAVFDVQATPLPADHTGDTGEPAPGEGHPADLPRPQRARLDELLDQQSRRALTRRERAELKSLIAAYGQRLEDYYLHDIARQRGISVAQARAEVTADLERALAEWRTFTADPEWRSRLVSRVYPGGASHTDHSQ